MVVVVGWCSAEQCVAVQRKIVQGAEKVEKKREKEKKVKLNWLFCDRCNYNSSDVGMQLILSRFRFRCSGFRFHSDLLFLKKPKSRETPFSRQKF